jgi:hypothetical protein
LSDGEVDAVVRVDAVLARETPLPGILGPDVKGDSARARLIISVEGDPGEKTGVADRDEDENVTEFSDRCIDPTGRGWPGMYMGMAGDMDDMDDLLGVCLTGRVLEGVRIGRGMSFGLRISMG